LGSHPGTQEKTFTETRIGEGRNEHQERQITEHDCLIVMKETVTDDGNKLGWANSFTKLSRHEIKFGIDSILDTAATPQRLKQWATSRYMKSTSL
jgi:hypothetical protein